MRESSKQHYEQHKTYTTNQRESERERVQMQNRVGKARLWRRAGGRKMQSLIANHSLTVDSTRTIEYGAIYRLSRRLTSRHSLLVLDDKSHGAGVMPRIVHDHTSCTRRRSTHWMNAPGKHLSTSTCLHVALIRISYTTKLVHVQCYKRRPTIANANATATATATTAIAIPHYNTFIRTFTYTHTAHCTHWKPETRAP